MSRNTRPGKAIHVRLTSGAVRAIDYLAVDWDCTRQDAAARLIDEGLERYDPRRQRDALLLKQEEGEDG